MMEIDWSVGEIMKALKSAGLDDNTLVIMTSDNGRGLIRQPRRQDAVSGGEGHRLRWRNAQRLHHAISRQIKAGSVSKRTFCTVDLLPTIAELAGAPLPKNPDRRQERLGPDHRTSRARRIRTTTTRSRRARSSKA